MEKRDVRTDEDKNELALATQQKLNVPVHYRSDVEGMMFSSVIAAAVLPFWCHQLKTTQIISVHSPYARVC